jgi:2'-5' RNA ligase
MATAGSHWPSGDDEYGDDHEDWARPAGIFVLAPIAGDAAVAIREAQRRFDPKLADAYPPHITLAGSSGVGPIRPNTPVDELWRRLAPVAAATPVLSLPVGRPQRFMQTQIISLPMDPHGPLRVLHDLIARSGLPFGPARFTFTPHVTLNLYRTQDPDGVRELLSLRVKEPAIIDRIVLSATNDPYPPRTLLDIPLTRAPAQDEPAD